MGRSLCARSQLCASVKRRPDPTVLPESGDQVVVAAVVDESAFAVTDLYRLARGDRDGGGKSNAGGSLPAPRVCHPVQARLTAVPEVRIERDPQPRAHVVAEMRFE